MYIYTNIQAVLVTSLAYLLSLLCCWCQLFLAIWWSFGTSKLETLTGHPSNTWAKEGSNLLQYLSEGKCSLNRFELMGVMWLETHFQPLCLPSCTSSDVHLIFSTHAAQEALGSNLSGSFRKDHDRNAASFARNPKGTQEQELSGDSKMPWWHS